MARHEDIHRLRYHFHVRLDPEEESKLKQIAALLQVENQSEAIRKMIHDTWLSLHINSTFVERRGGHPEVLLLDGQPDLSERATRKALVKEYFEKKAARRNAVHFADNQ